LPAITTFSGLFLAKGKNDKQANLISIDCLTSFTPQLLVVLILLALITKSRALAPPVESIDLKCLVVQLVADQQLEGGALDPDLHQQARPPERAKAQ
jgi:hypothetical protein